MTLYRNFWEFSFPKSTECDRMDALLPMQSSTSRGKEVLKLQDYLFVLLVSIAANVISDYIIRWLHQD